MAVTAREDVAGFRETRGQIAAVMGRWDDAVDDLEHSLRQGHDSADLISTLSKARDQSQNRSRQTHAANRPRSTARANCSESIREIRDVPPVRVNWIQFPAGRSGTVLHRRKTPAPRTRAQAGMRRSHGPSCPARPIR